MVVLVGYLQLNESDGSTCEQVEPGGCGGTRQRIKFVGTDCIIDKAHCTATSTTAGILSNKALLLSSEQCVYQNFESDGMAVRRQCCGNTAAVQLGRER